MRQKYYQGFSKEGFHPLAYTEWGHPENTNVLMCVPGFNRNSRDFDYLADYLSKDYRVVCPDLAGRGKSERLIQGRSYSNFQYLHDLTTLIARLDVREIDFLGSSMGGILGIFLASFHQSPIRRLILNDVGPILPRENVERIKRYALKESFFQTYDQGADFIRRAYKTFGIQDETHWTHFIAHSLTPKEDGYTLSFDPRVADTVTWHLDPDVGCFQQWDQIKCPILVLHGAESNILTPSILSAMGDRAVPFDYHAFNGCGHTPNLMQQDHMDVVAHWLGKD